VVSLGGATEASVWSVAFPVAEVSPRWRSIPYGRALAGQSIEVLDPELSPLVDGEVGELYLGGRGVALGYWRDARRTVESFVPHPTTGERLFRTGDLGRRMADGEVELLGRKDLQVKIRGFRVELTEVEAALTSCPEIELGVVSVLGERDGERQLVAHYVVNGGTPGDLRRQLLERLPEHMVPQHFLECPRLPLSANGKIDRKALAEAARESLSGPGGSRR
jgi:acyl-CoA synthetase (AMP-forming)/AMP-acid ligase II